MVVFEAEAVAEAVDEDEATKAVSRVRKTARTTSRNAYQTKNISIAKKITSALTVAVLATLEVIVAHLVILSDTSRRPRTTKRKPSKLEAITAYIEARNNLMAERTLYASTKTTRISTTISIPPTATRTTTLRSALPSAQKTTRAPG